MNRDVHIAHRANELLNLPRFSNADQTVDGIPLSRYCLDIPDSQYVLRMLIQSPTSDGLQIPPELQWLDDAIKIAADNQRRLYKNHPYVYVTVRSGVVQSTTDDEWHVDGFSLRVPHEPEQNYVWADCWPTEHLNQQFAIPVDFDPLRHNLHYYFQDHADETKVEELACEYLHLIDPYIVHRRPRFLDGVRRTFFRISFVPIEIEDDGNTPNPLLPTRTYNRTDIRRTLTRYTP